MRFVLLTIPALFFSNILSANEKVSPVNETNIENFWSSPVITGALCALTVIIFLVVVRVVLDVIDLYTTIKKASRRGGCTNQIPLTIKPYPML